MTGTFVMTKTDRGRKLISGAIIAAALFTGAAASADEIELRESMQAASLHEGGIDMVVYFLEHDDHFEVVGTYAAVDAAHDPARIRMGLVDGDSVSFSMPGQDQVRYSFARKGDVVSVSADPVESEVASIGDLVETADLID